MSGGQDAVSHKRNEQGAGQDHELSGSFVMLGEASRSAVQQTAQKKEEEQVSLFWRVFGGTLLSMIALGALTLYNSISSNIAELRSELNREREARAELVKKDEFNSRLANHSERVRALDALKADLEGIKERVNANVSALDSLKKDTATSVESVKKDTATIADAVKKDGAGLDVLKEKFLTASADLKTIREDIGKLQQEADRNKSNDAERKASRDVQAKQLDDTLKELQRGLQDCREKLARLEGSRGVGMSGEVPTIPARPVAPAETKGPGDAGDGSKANPEKTPGAM